jgi:hypothetical protein
MSDDTTVAGVTSEVARPAARSACSAYPPVDQLLLLLRRLPYESFSVLSIESSDDPRRES